MCCTARSFPAVSLRLLVPAAIRSVKEAIDYLQQDDTRARDERARTIIPGHPNHAAQFSIHCTPNRSVSLP